MHFTFEELSYSRVAEKAGISNEIPREKYKNMEVLIAVLEKVRVIWGAPITVNSGYRNEAVNKLVGGVAISHHLANKGYAAADITVGSKYLNKDLFRKIKDKLKELGIDQIICEQDGKWLHISTNIDKSKCRHQAFSA